MKKLITWLTLSALLVASTSITAFAANNAPYDVCMVDGCNVAGTHQHDGNSYGGHAMGDGHTYHNGTGQHRITRGHNRHKGGCHR